MNLFKSISIYTISNISRQAVGFLLLPVITTYLSTGQTGDLSTITVMMSLLSPFIWLSAHSAVNLEFFRQDQGEANFNLYLSSSLVNPVLSFLGFTLLFVIIAPWLSNWLAIDRLWLMLVPLLCFGNVIPNLVSVLYQARKKPVAHSVYNLGATIIDLTLAVLLIAGFAMSWQGRLWALLSTKIIFTLIGIYLLWRGGYLRWRISKPFVSNALIFGLPLIPHAAATGIMDFSDHIFIREMVSKEAQGVYAIAYKVGSIMMILQASVMLAWTPTFYEKLKVINRHNTLYIVSVSYLLLIALLLAGLLLTAAAPFIFALLIDPDYAGGLRYVGWIAMAYVFLGWYKLFVGYIFYLKKTHLLGYLAVFNVLTNLLLNYFLIRQFGALGAAYATAASYFLFFVITVAISHRLHPMPWLAFRDIYNFVKLKITLDQ